MIARRYPRVPGERYDMLGCHERTDMAKSYLNRYTDLPALIHILVSKRIALLNPQTWDDKNDSFFMSKYKEGKKAKTLLALCFTERRETYHQWRVFSNGSNGVCIEFDKAKLLTAFESDRRRGHILHDNVKYSTLHGMKPRTTITADELPFLKRFAFKDETEFRVIYVNTDKELPVREYDIDLGWINKITLSPWMPEPLYESSKATLKAIPDCEGLLIARSTLVDNEKWKDLATRVRP